eukprot:2887776-Karenia_brevis.AAC.1
MIIQVGLRTIQFPETTEHGRLPLARWVLMVPVALAVVAELVARHFTGLVVDVLVLVPLMQVE